jgi:serine/threonine-protein kinase
MVAASGTQGALALSPALAIVSAILVLLAVTLLITTRAQLQNFVPGEKSPDVLKQYIRDALHDAGYDTKIADSAYWFGASDNYFDYSRQIPSPRRYNEIPNYFPSPVYLTLRQSSSQLAAPPTYPLGDNFPAFTVPGESIATVDTEGHLTSFHVVPLDAPPPATQSNSTELPNNFDWTPIFADAGLDLRRAKPVPANWYPRIPSDVLFAWDVPHAGKNVRVEAATFRGRPVYFKVVPVWDIEKPAGTSTEGVLPESAGRVEAVNLGIMLISVFVCIFLTRRNLRLKRGDLRGAWRAGLCVFVLMTFNQLVASHWIMDSFWQWDLFFTSLGIGAAYGIVFMLLYLSAEPFLRRTWPEPLVSWTRLVNGQYRDPMIGRDVLMGTVIGLAIAAVSELMYALPHWFSVQGITPPFNFDVLGGNLMFLGQITRQWTSPFINTMGILVFVLIAWKIVRLKWIALTLTFITYTVIMLAPENPLGLLPFSIAIAALGMFAVIRYGALAIFVALGMREIFSLSAITLDLHRWYAYQTPILILVVLAITAYGFLLSIRPHLHSQ